MHLHAPHDAGVLGEKPCVPAGIGVEIDLLNADERGAILVLVLFQGFKERKGRDEAGGAGWERKVEDCRRFRRGYW